MFERLMSAWISAFAALVFLVAITLAVVEVIAWLHVAYVYVSITLITLLLAALVYTTKSSN